MGPCPQRGQKKVSCPEYQVTSTGGNVDGDPPPGGKGTGGGALTNTLVHARGLPL